MKNESNQICLPEYIVSGCYFWLSDEYSDTHIRCGKPVIKYYIVQSDFYHGIIGFCEKHGNHEYTGFWNSMDEITKEEVTVFEIMKM